MAEYTGKLLVWAGVRFPYALPSNMNDKTETYDICLKITGEFEGAGFDTVSGDFDSQGLSVGILQFNVGKGTLSEYILKHITKESHKVFPISITPLLELPPIDALTFVRNNMLNDDKSVKPEWIKAWKMFLSKPSVIELQKKAALVYFNRAKKLCNKYGFNENNRMHMAFFFDMAIHVWSSDVEVYFFSPDQCANILQRYGVDNMQIWLGAMLTPNQQKLVTLAHMRALQCKAEWRNAFFHRKATIAIGYGIVNKQKYDFRKLFKGCL